VSTEKTEPKRFRRYVVAALSITLLSFGAAVPAGASETSGGGEDTIQGWNRTYDESDGIVFEEEEVMLPSSGSHSGVGVKDSIGLAAVAMSGSSGTYKVTRGASYVQSHHPHALHLRYFGKAYAAGNLYQGQYVAAIQNSKCVWKPGKVVEYSVFDDLRGGPKYVTKFAVKFGMVSKQLC
jgi:hypothetical protein